MSSRSIRRKYGQNYLVDKAILFEMANHVSAKENDSFIEIGPGMGALTDLININNVNVTAIDIDENNVDDALFYAKEDYWKKANAAGRSQ